ncbi:unnamed protein product [Urochloa decumbens]|uniref:RING-type domain-containing protein n=1 Tax=Urochloa decumbens TaxID=240449 RepID=A0ABC9BHT2_9POAL
MSGSPPGSPQEPDLLFCHECRMAVILQELPPVPLSSPPRVCPNCSRGFLEEDPPPPLSPPPPVPAPPSPPPLVCRCCGGLGLGIPANDHPTSPSASPPTPPPPPPPQPYPVSASGSSSSELSDDPDGGDDLDLLGTGYGAASAFFRSFAARRPGDGSRVAAFAAATDLAAAALRDGRSPTHRAGAFDTILHRPLGLPLGPNPAVLAGGEPPAPAASIAALPTVEVAELAAACAICKDDLPLASQATRLPCSHLYHSNCIVTWLQLHNSCPVCRFRIPAAAPESAAASEEDSLITIRFTTSTRRRSGRVQGDAAAAAAAPISASPTQLAQALTGDGAGGPANSGETVSSEWPRQPESDAVMSEAREEDDID